MRLPACARRSSAATTRSIRMKREPLTSTRHAGAQRRARARRPAPRRVVEVRGAGAERGDRVARERRRARAGASMPALARVRADLARGTRGPARPVRPCRPCTSTRAPGAARQHVDRGAHRIRDWRCSVSSMHDARRRGARRVAAGPCTARNAVEARARPRASATPAASAAAAAASALRTLCAPGDLQRRRRSSPCGVTIASTLPSDARLAAARATSAPARRGRSHDARARRARRVAPVRRAMRVVGVDHRDAVAAAAPRIARACSARDLARRSP